MRGDADKECRPGEPYEPPDEVDPGGDTDVKRNKGVALEGADTIFDEESAETHREVSVGGGRSATVHERSTTRVREGSQCASTGDDAVPGMSPPFLHARQTTP